MPQYEYRVLPAPRRAEKSRGLKSVPDRFAHALTQVMNEMAREGWEYLRADTLPCEERTGLTGKLTSSYQSVLIFRREVVVQVARMAPTTPVAAQPVPRLGSATGEAGQAPPIGPTRDVGTEG
ncbi:MAG: DUF4177 domain-containing protein [Gemmobacter sp.]|jgi:hypothetical protein|nr:DUF4177 domain-containing protein [Gemmobacter sp.]